MVFFLWSSRKDLYGKRNYRCDRHEASIDAYDLRNCRTQYNKGTENLVLVGIKTRGLYLAQRIAANLKKLEDVEITVGAIDVSQYRDDLPKSKK